MATENSWVSSVSVDTQSDDLNGMLTSTPRQRRPLSLSIHARRRGARRNVEPDAVDYVLAHGRMIQRTGVTFFFLGRRDVPSADRGMSWASRLEGTIVLLASDGAVITVYRNRHGLPAILRKVKYRLPDLHQWPEEADVTPMDEVQWATA
jgi:hypothetical protein